MLFLHAATKRVVFSLMTGLSQMEAFLFKWWIELIKKLNYFHIYINISIINSSLSDRSIETWSIAVWPVGGAICKSAGITWSVTQQQPSLSDREDVLYYRVIRHWWERLCYMDGIKALTYLNLTLFISASCFSVLQLNIGRWFGKIWKWKSNKHLKWKITKWNWGVWGFGTWINKFDSLFV